MKDLKIAETKDYDRLVPMFIAHRLEFSEDEPVPTDIVKCWQLTDETLKRGGSSIFLVARAPGFFRKSGFVTIERDEAPQFFECFTCPQYGTECRPEVMRLDIK